MPSIKLKLKGCYDDISNLISLIDAIQRRLLVKVHIFNQVLTHTISVDNSLHLYITLAISTYITMKI